MLYVTLAEQEDCSIKNNQHWKAIFFHTHFFSSGYKKLLIATCFEMGRHKNWTVKSNIAS